MDQQTISISWTLASGLIGSVLTLIGAWGLQAFFRHRDLLAIRAQINSLLHATEVRMRTTAAEPKLDLAKDVWSYWDVAYQIAMTPEGARAVAGHRNAFGAIVELQRGRYLLLSAMEIRDRHRNSGSAAAFQEEYEGHLRANCANFANILCMTRKALGDMRAAEVEQNVVDHFLSK